MKIALITGASGGLGRDFSVNLKKVFSVDQIWLVARRADKLEETGKLCGTDYKIITADLQQGVKPITDALEAEKPQIEVLIANAGLGFYGDFSAMNEQKLSSMCDVNVKALTLCVNASLPYMQANSHIILTSSIASFVPNAYMTVYSSTKAYVTSFARALKFELKSKKISVTAVCPGPMATDFEKVGEVTSKRFFRLPFCISEKVALSALKAAKRNKLIYTNKFFYKFYRLLAKILPTSWLMKMASC